jgi:uncharacterized membrane protein
MNPEIFVHLFHILIVGTLFLYVGIKRDKIPSYMYPILLGLGIIIIFYHIYKTYNYIKVDKPYWVNLIHILLHLFTFQTPILTAKKIKKCKINSRNFTYDGLTFSSSGFILEEVKDEI